MSCNEKGKSERNQEKTFIDKKNVRKNSITSCL